MITGKRIRLRHVEAADIPLFQSWLNDPEVRAGISMYLPVSMQEEEQWFENVLKQPQAERPLAIEAQDGETWKLIGNSAFHEIDWRSRNAEVGIMIGDKDYWNRGYGSETMGLLLTHGFRTLNLHRIWLRVFATNLRAIRAYEKAGFQHEGRKREAEFIEGSYVDTLLMSVLRPEWEATGKG